MNTLFESKIARVNRLCLGVCTLSAFAAAQAGAAVIPPLTENFDQVGWIDFSGSYVSVDGRDATFRQRHQMPTGVSGGVDSFFWEHFLTRDLTMVIEGQSLFKHNDHLVNVRFINQDTGFIHVGFKNTRVWYDGTGGWFPDGDLFFPPQHDEMSIDRGEFWIEGELNSPDTPLINLRYTHQYRRGLKDSTVWGRTTNTAIAPSYRDIDETRHIFEGRGQHEVANTEVGLGLRYEMSDQENVLNIDQSRGQAAERRIRHTEKLDTDAVSARAWTKTDLTENTQLSTAYMFTRLDTDLGGSRIFDPAPAFREYDMTNVGGGSKVKQHVVNLNVMTRPWENFVIIPSARFEKLDQDTISRFEQNGAPREMGGERDALTFSQRLEMRYTGVPRWHFLARGDWMQSDGDRIDSLTNLGTGAVMMNRETEFERRHQEYTLGANWYPTRGISAATRYSRRIRKSDYDHPIAGAAAGHPAFLQKQDFTTDAFNIRVTTRPMAGVTLVSRYDLELTTIDTRGSGAALDGSQIPLPGSVKSGDRERHALSQSATWMPVPRLFLMGSVNYTIDSLKTPANDSTGPSTDRVLKSEHDYLFVTTGANFAYTERTDFSADYFYYLSDNYRDNSPSSQPYGVGEREHGIRLGMVYRIEDNLLWRVGYGFFTYRDKGTWGGNRDYDVHFAHTGVTVHF